MKRKWLFLVLVLAAGTLYAHDKGDLILGADHQLGFAIPSINLMSNYSMFPGPCVFWGATAEYYFTDFFALGAGLGYSGNYHIFNTVTNVNPELYAIPIVNIFVFLFQIGDLLIPDKGTFGASYISIPFGLRFSAKAFTFGAGATANFPVHGTSSYTYTSENNDGYYSSTTEETISFTLRPYMGWYADIGLDFSGREGKRNGFGLFFRLNGTITREIAAPSPSIPEYSDSTFGFLSMSLVFRASFELTNQPIGGNAK